MTDTATPTGEAATDDGGLLDQLRALVGSEGPPTVSRHAVNEAMIAHWCDAMGDDNPLYLDEAFAAGTPVGGIVAPAAMLDVWDRGGLKHVRSADSPRGRALALLEAAGFTSVVAVNSELELRRYVRPGERLSNVEVLDAVSEEKATGLGVGHFVTTRTEYRDQDGELVGSMMFRILKFRPREKAAAKMPRPRPSTNLDNQFFFDGAKDGKLLIQKCTSCGALRHPPWPMCPSCQSLEWEAIEASGKGTVYSFVTNHYPQVPSFDYPLNVSLIELEEGVRLVSNVVGVEADAVEIGMAVEVEFTAFDDELTLPQFRPVGSA